MAFKKIFHYNLHPGPFGRVYRVYHCNKCLPLPLLWLRLTRRLQSLWGVLSLAISQSFQACTCCVTDHYVAQYEVRLFQCGLFHGPQYLSEIYLPQCSLTSRVTCSVVGLSTAKCFEMLQDDPENSHWCLKMYLLQGGHVLGTKSLQRYTCCATDIITATGMDYPQVTVLLTKVHTRVPACQ